MNFPTTIEGRERQSQPPVAGKIKIGIKVKAVGKGGKEYETPKAIDHFRFVPSEGPDAPRLLAAWDALYARPQGGRPVEVPVMLPGTDRTKYFPQAYRAYKRGRLWCVGNNSKADRRTDDWADWHTVDCNAHCPYRVLKGATEKIRICDVGGRLSLLLPEMPALGVFQLEASSMSMDSLDSCLDVIENAAANIGVPVSRIPLWLQLKAVPNTRYGTVYVYQLVVRTSLQKLAAAGQGPSLLLGASPVDGADVGTQDTDVGAVTPSETHRDPADHRPVEPAPPTEVVDEDLEEELRGLRRRCNGLILSIPATQRQSMGQRVRDAGDDIQTLTELRDELMRLQPGSPSDGAAQ